MSQSPFLQLRNSYPCLNLYMRNNLLSKIIILILLPIVVIGCPVSVQSEKAQSTAPDKKESAQTEHRIIASIETPTDFQRINLDPGSFSEYVRNLPLKPVGTAVYSYDGTLIKDADSVAGVIDWLLPSEVQQCADVAIRLRAEYLRHVRERDKIVFKSVSGVQISYAKGLKGKYSLNQSGSAIIYSPTSKTKSDSGDEFEKYLHFVMLYANSASLDRDLTEIDADKILPGDLYIQPDRSGRAGIGHVSVILDVCEGKEGQRLYLFGYGFIPAQDFHLPLPESGQGVGNWFSLDGWKESVERFGAGEFHRF